MENNKTKRPTGVSIALRTCGGIIPNRLSVRCCSSGGEDKRICGREPSIRRAVRHEPFGSRHARRDVHDSTTCDRLATWPRNGKQRRAEMESSHRSDIETRAACEQRHFAQVDFKTEYGRCVARAEQREAPAQRFTGLISSVRRHVTPSQRRMRSRLTVK